MAHEKMKCGGCPLMELLEMFNEYKVVRDQLDDANMELLEEVDRHEKYVERMRALCDDLPVTPEEFQHIMMELKALRQAVKEYKEMEPRGIGGLFTQLILYDTGPGPVRKWSCGKDGFEHYVNGFEHYVKQIAKKPGVTEVVYYKAVGRIRNRGGDEVGEYEELSG